MKKKDPAQIDYDEVMKLGFKETIHNDPIYFKQNGFEYAIVELKLAKNLYLDWDKETKLCEMSRVDNKRDLNIMARRPIRNLEHLKETVAFFLKNK